jgi:hypothetical protein
VTHISVPPQSAAQPLQDISEVQEPPKMPWTDRWADGRTVPKSNQPKLILSGVVDIKPGIAALLANGTPCGSFSVLLMIPL